MGVFQTYCCSGADVWKAALEVSGITFITYPKPLQERSLICLSLLWERIAVLKKERTTEET